MADDNKSRFNEPDQKGSQAPDQKRNQTNPLTASLSGSGSDANSDSRRLLDPENLLDKQAEDSFPASDPPSTTPITGIGQNNEDRSDPSGLPPDFKNNTKAQFQYGRRVEKATHHFDRQSNRLDKGNPDVGEIDLGTIEADKPAQPDDHDHYDTADDGPRAEREY